VIAARTQALQQIASAADFPRNVVTVDSDKQALPDRPGFFPQPKTIPGVESGLQRKASPCDEGRDGHAVLVTHARAGVRARNHSGVQNPGEALTSQFAVRPSATAGVVVVFMNFEAKAVTTPLTIK